MGVLNRVRLVQQRGNRSPLQVIDKNQNSGSSKKPTIKRSLKGCIECKFALCNDCLQQHLQAANEGHDTENEALSSTESETSDTTDSDM